MNVFQLAVESHGSQGYLDTWVPPQFAKAWWTAGATAGHAGVGIIVSQAFFSRFSDSEWKPWWSGRAGRLRLAGDLGTLDVVVSYFPTGTGIPSAADTYGAPRSCCYDNWPALRHALRRKLADSLAPATTALTILGGDFN